MSVTSVRRAMHAVAPGVLAYTALLVGIATVLARRLPAATETAAGAWSLHVLVVAGGFALAEATALHVEIKKQIYSMSLSSIPLVVGLVHLSPVELVVATISGSALALLFVRRVGVLKTIWNLSLFAAEALLAATIVREALGLVVPLDASDWAVVLLAVLAAELLGLVAVPLVIVVVERRFRWDLFTGILRSQLLAAASATFAVTTVAASMAEPLMMAFAVLPLAGVAVLLHSHGLLTQRYGDLSRLHDFARALSIRSGAGTIDAALVKLAELLRTRIAGVLIVSDDSDASHLHRAVVDDQLVDRDADELVERLPSAVAPGRVAVLQRGQPLIDDLLQALDAERALAIRVLGELDRLAVLYVADRQGMRSEHDSGEIDLFASIARTLSARLTNDDLVQRIDHQARHDALTGLPQRMTVEEDLARRLEDETSTGIVAVIGIDRFKQINDALGHAVGDRILCELADRLRSTRTAVDASARLGDSEFAVVLDGADRHTELEQLLSTLTEPLELEGIRFEVSVSAGAVQWPRDGVTSADLLRRAHGAADESERHGTQLRWHEIADERDGMRELALSMSLNTAFDTDQFDVHLQPKVAIPNGELVGAEALARWHHPELGMVPPSEFVPLVDRAGLGERLRRWVVTRAVEAAAELSRRGIDLTISVNLTARDLLDPRLPDELAHAVTHAGLRRGALSVEITEDSTVVDLESTVNVLRRLRAGGITVAIDDFGTGYSSLEHLHQLPCDQLKLDRSFAIRLTEDPRSRAIVRAAVVLAAELGMSSLIEGVEDVDTLAAAHALGVDEVQGYVFSRPLPLDELVSWTRSGLREAVVTELQLASAATEESVAGSASRPATWAGTAG